jgi:hypothetical protein
MKEKKKILVNVLDYVEGKLTIEGIIANAQEHNADILFTDIYIMTKGKNDRDVVNPIVKLIYSCNIDDIKVFLTVSDPRNKDVVELKELPSWYTPTPEDIIFEMDYNEACSSKYSTEDIVKMCREKNATVFKINNSPEIREKKDNVILHILRKELMKNRIFEYDPLEEMRAKKRAKEKTNLDKKENLTEYEPKNLWNNNSN